MLSATSSFQVLEDTVGGKAASDQIHDLLMCNYWIEVILEETMMKCINNFQIAIFKAPAGSTIEVVIEKYKIAIDTSGCPFEGVEVKTGSDVRHTGYRFCSTKSNMTLVSTRNIVPVITYASVYHQLKTVLHYRIASTGSNVSQTTPEPTFVTTSRPASRLTTPLTSPKAETPTTRETSEPSVASTWQPTPNISTIAPPNPCRDTDVNLNISSPSVLTILQVHYIERM
ncbi:Astacin (Peptidase M12A) [Parelaphostrongylus tenuis]|uniref:Astacin (Peptidase M12A) n=1 Tax=Parelaphostrongylus tenuis TaxID=148309 RepID=A0AAD5MT36_PARTN|nr:Astacin (Peptidase M12A) [Parelaphostrongylus tenuis]